MKDVIYLLFHLLTTLAKLIKSGGGRTVIAENLLLKQQLIIHSRARQRAPNLFMLKMRLAFNMPPTLTVQASKISVSPMSSVITPFPATPNSYFQTAITNRAPDFHQETDANKRQITLPPVF